MKKNKPESTSATVASIAAKLLRNPKTSKQVRKIAASALTQKVKRKK